MRRSVRPLVAALLTAILLVAPAAPTPAQDREDRAPTVTALGAAPALGAPDAAELDAPIVAMAANPVGAGYWLATRSGAVHAFGDTGLGSTDGGYAAEPIVGIAPTSTGAGYWLVAIDGGVFAFGDAEFHGSMGGLPLNGPIVGMAATATGDGYWLVAADGGIFSFGDAAFAGSTGSLTLNAPIVGMAADPDGEGYWLVAADGGIFAFEATFSGSTGSLALVAPVTGMAADPDGEGYLLVAADGGVFAFDATFDASAVTDLPAEPAVGIVTATGGGAWVVRATAPPRPSSATLSMRRTATIGGAISPKSIVHNGDGLFIAQNMMYRHTMTVYDRSARLVATIPDSVVLADFGIAGARPGVVYQGAPVEAAFESTGRYAYVSNYRMYGPGYTRPGSDGCSPGGWDESFVYRVNTRTMAIDQVIPVGSVPKFVAVTPDDRYVLVSNWCSYDLSVIDVASATEIARVPIGRFPRGIAVTADSRTAYVAAMGTTDIAVVDLTDLAATPQRLRGVGRSPRHLILHPEGHTLYATLNGEGTIARIDTATGAVTGRVRTGDATRSMTIADDGDTLYVVNYRSNSVSAVRTADMLELQELPTGVHPIGITYDAETRQVWVSVYRGAIEVFQTG
ncbi:MAG: YncE family protein [Actinomycetota bacterium]